VGAFEFKNGGTQNFLVSGGGNTMRLNAPAGAQVLNLNTAAVSQQSQIQFTYGTPGSGTAGYGIYRPANTGDLGFYSYPLGRNHLYLNGANGNTAFIGAAGTAVAVVNSIGQIISGDPGAGRNGAFICYQTLNNNGGPLLSLNKSVDGGNTVSGSELGIIDFLGYANGGYRRSSLILVQQSGASSGNNIPSDMSFQTGNADFGTGERLRITQTSNENTTLIIRSRKAGYTPAVINSTATLQFAPSEPSNFPFATITGADESSGSGAGIYRASLRFSTNFDGLAERMRITPEGNLRIGYTGVNNVYRISSRGGGDNFGSLETLDSNGAAGLLVFQWPGSTYVSGWSSTASVCYIGKANTTNRSVNAAGTLNANGADYAEYVEKDVSDQIIEKSCIAGFKSNGKLTTRWSEAKSYVIKSTDPSFVGGDSWSSRFGMPPVKPESQEPLAINAWEAELAEYNAKVEAERLKYDRMAYSGQVPVNVRGAVAGDYIVAVEGADDTITGIAVSEEDITFAQYKKAVGRVIKVLEDGRAFVNVIVH
jgi:hypothetical protein